MKYSDIAASLTRRAKKVSTDSGIFYLNELIKSDIFLAAIKTWKDYFEEEVEIPMVDGTTVYAMPSDFYAQRLVEDQDGKIILRGANTPRDVTPKDKITIYSGQLTTNADRSYDTLYVTYYKNIPDFDKTNDIDLPDEIAAALKLIWVTGIEYFYFSDRKKQQETRTAYARYEDAKKMILSYTVGSLNL